MAETLLIELLTEELPPSSLNALGESFARAVVQRLCALGFAAAPAASVTFATPRRLAVQVEAVEEHQSEQQVSRRGPAVAAGFTPDGVPTPALAGFARSCGVAADQLERVTEGKTEYFLFRSTRAGESLAAHLAAVVAESLKQLPIPKLMRWGDSEVQFVRPVHGLVMLHGDRVVPGTVLGLAAGNSTRGHRFRSTGAVRLPRAQDYAALLEREGGVVAAFAQRRERVYAALLAAAGGASLGDCAALLDEVTALVEAVAVYEGCFSEEFLAVPQECLILSMKQHQKYFPLFDADTGRLLARFLIVSNLPTAQPAAIIKGNERVLRARLSDAKFFYDQDRRIPLAQRVERLGQVVYHNRLGSQLQRVERIRKLAGTVAERLGADVAAAERAAWLCKADLLTDMVGEFHELQGVMGHYYALGDGEPAAVAAAIEAHYLPRHAADALPGDAVGLAVALADKCDTLVGIYGIGLVPTGDKDPFGLRRAAVGILRMLVEKALPLDLVELLSSAALGFGAQSFEGDVVRELHTFALDRLRGYLRERDFAADEIDAVLAEAPTRMDLVLARLEAVQAFRGLAEAQALAVANKRIRNILRKSPPGASAAVRVDLLQEPAERQVFDTLLRLEPRVAEQLQAGAFREALLHLAGLREPVDAFFDAVLVNAPEEELRNNRLALLQRLEVCMNQVADISRLAPDRI